MEYGKFQLSFIYLYGKGLVVRRSFIRAKISRGLNYKPYFRSYKSPNVGHLEEFQVE